MRIIGQAIPDRIIAVKAAIDILLQIRDGKGVLHEGLRLTEALQLVQRLQKLRVLDAIGLFGIKNIDHAQRPPHDLLYQFGVLAPLHMRFEFFQKVEVDLEEHQAHQTDQKNYPTPGNQLPRIAHTDLRAPVDDFQHKGLNVGLVGFLGRFTTAKKDYQQGGRQNKGTHNANRRIKGHFAQGLHLGYRHHQKAQRCGNGCHQTGTTHLANSTLHSGGPVIARRETALVFQNNVHGLSDTNPRDERGHNAEEHPQHPTEQPHKACHQHYTEDDDRERPNHSHQTGAKQKQREQRQQQEGQRNADGRVFHKHKVIGGVHRHIAGDKELDIAIGRIAQDLANGNITHLRVEIIQRGALFRIKHNLGHGIDAALLHLDHYRPVLGGFIHEIINVQRPAHHQIAQLQQSLLTFWNLAHQLADVNGIVVGPYKFSVTQTGDFANEGYAGFKALGDFVNLLHGFQIKGTVGRIRHPIENVADLVGEELVEVVHVGDIAFVTAVKIGVEAVVTDDLGGEVHTAAK